MPTPAGRSFVAGAEVVPERLSEAERAAAGEYTAPKGDLVVTAPAMLGRLHVLPAVTGPLRTPPPSVPGPASDAPMAERARWREP